MNTSISFLSSVDEGMKIRIYGKTIKDFSIETNEHSRLGENVVFAQIYGIKALGTCHKLPNPILSILPGTGIAASECPEFDPKEFLMWTLPKEHLMVTFSPLIRTMDELIANELRPFIDVEQEFGIHNLKVHDGVISGSLRAKLKLHQKLSWPLPDLNVTVVDGNFPFSFNIASACYPVITVGVASAQLCVSLNPNKICGEIKFSVPLPFGLHFDRTFTIACVGF